MTLFEGGKLVSMYSRFRIQKGEGDNFVKVLSPEHVSYPLIDTILLFFYYRHNTDANPTYEAPTRVVPDEFRPYSTIADSGDSRSTVVVYDNLQLEMKPATPSVSS